MSVLAIYLIALTSILSAAAMPLTAGTASDPFSVICHSVAPDQSGTDSQAPASLPQHACDHCNLCSATPAAASVFDSAFIGYLSPIRLLHVLSPADAGRGDDIGGSPGRARGPPFTA